MNINKKKMMILFAFSIILLSLLPKLSEAAIIKLKVKVSAANIRIGPSLTDNIIIQVTQGVILESEARQGEWYKVSLPPTKSGEKRFGYVHQSTVELIEEIKEPQKEEKIEKEVQKETENIVDKKEQEQQAEVGRKVDINKIPEEKKIIIAEIKTYYLNPSEQAIKDIYGGGMAYGGEINIGIMKNLDLWASVFYFSKKGQLTFTKEETKLTIIPIGLGIKYKILERNIKPYIGLGLNYFQFKENNPIEDVSKSGIGYIGEIGSLYEFKRQLLIDLFLGYTYCKMVPADFEINIGGLKAGIGIGYRF